MGYIPVSFAAIAAALTSRSFTRSEARGHEVTFERGSKARPGLKLVVYTSVKVGQESVRKCGADALRVALVYDGPRGRTGVMSFTRVHRTGANEAAVVDRLVNRIREAATASQRFGTCPHCGAPTYADTGHCVARCAGRSASERLREKAEFAALERAQEEAAYMAEMATEFD